jgi:prepilin-type N-terminal cleavage/methylation domain-containing protein
MKCDRLRDASGFTLIEVIVTVLVVAIFGGMMIVFLSDSIVKSSQSVGKLKKVSDLNKVMANITQYYDKYPKWRSTVTYAVGNFVVPTLRNGRYYKCTIAGTSNLNEPTSWPTIPGDYIIETANVLKWTETTENGLLPDLNAVKTSIGAENTNQSNEYGIYRVEKNRCVYFLVADSEQDEPSCISNILRVTIRSDQGEALTALFSFRYP